MTFRDAPARNSTSVIGEYERRHIVDGDFNICKAVFTTKTRRLSIDLNMRLPEMQ